MMRHAAVLVWVTVLLISGKSSASDQPNVVLVITDDQGYGDLSCHGNPTLKTPYLDELYGASVRCVDYHVAPTCSPTRSALMTGHWTNRTGVWHTIMGRSLLRANEVTLGTIFSDAGYATGMFGKWHLGDNYPYRPEDRGFGEVMRHGGGGVGQTPDYWDNAYFNGSYFHNSEPTPVEGFCTDVFFDYARRFIRAQKDASRPFFAYIATNAPHGPMHAPPSFSAPYRELGTATANFFGMIANIDHNVGRLREFLREEGLEQNTIFIFTTDNGTAAGERVYNAAMRGKKGSPYDGGHRVPLFFHWPGGNLTGGREVSEITAHVDLAPTLIDLCGIAGPDNVHFDGRSIRPLLADAEAAQDWPERILVTDSQRVKDPIKWRQSAVMTRQWRLINGQELYDIQVDPSQKKDVAADHPGVTQRLRAFYEAWWNELEPTFKVDCPIYLGHSAENPANLTCHDWITARLAPWNHGHIRSAARGPKMTGYWNVKVTQAGTYAVRLRRWPREAGHAIDASLPPGPDVPGVQAYRARPGKKIEAVRATIRIGTQEQELPVPAGAEVVECQFDLPAGETQLATRFYTADGIEYGAYYAEIERLTNTASTP